MATDRLLVAMTLKLQAVLKFRDLALLPANEPNNLILRVTAKHFPKATVRRLLVKASCHFLATNKQVVNPCAM